MKKVDFMSVLHKKTTRDYLARVNDKDFPKYKAKLREMEVILMEEMKLIEDPYELWDQKNK